jgi:hypothetical protein
VQAIIGRNYIQLVDAPFFRVFDQTIPLPIFHDVLGKNFRFGLRANF